jgi:hypothetical protein
MAFLFRIGGGVTLLRSETLPHTDMGVSIRLYPSKYFFFEAGADYEHKFKEFPFGFGFFYPSVGIGLRF